MVEIIKTTKQKKCDLCDESAILKIKKEEEEPYMYLCKACHNEMLRADTEE
ncbi:hypothetical protein J4216_00840 [Candidatus Woesearchaeota archaeon]|nr:hypothetical protein [Candidatus Woesearchaeota archaeon]